MVEYEIVLWVAKINLFGGGGDDMCCRQCKKKGCLIGKQAAGLPRTSFSVVSDVHHYKLIWCCPKILDPVHLCTYKFILIL